METAVRSFLKEDWHAVSRIYKEGLETGIATFETACPNWKTWDAKYISRCRLVAVKDHQIVGFAVLSQVSKRDVYKGVAEVSVYVSKNFRGKQVGESLLRHLIKASEDHGFWTLQANIFTENEASIKMHLKCGFRVVGVREKIGMLKGRWHDNQLLERRSLKIK
ncbi:GNAT family N-acetyltransferase [Flavivirga algicola]|uniref:N-acetyltransferase n=1 Tax=Flavivirga algicola TaxID=2729136 RepID=A0ABX1S183_9FLAO|nr:GNAT family N-acetyltransferase [Flavivirga algicola]NMH89106.1 N-acetyltransferase [Flavivirga algicola]